MKAMGVTVLIMLALFVVLLGCTQPGPVGIVTADPLKDPAAAFSQLVDSSKTLDNYHATYDSSVDMGMIINLPTENWKKGTKEKTSMTMTIMGMEVKVLVFKDGNSTTTCSQATNPQTGELTTQCNDQPANLPSSYQMSDMPASAKAIFAKTLKYVGEKKISDKFDCYDFNVNLTAADANIVFGQGGTASTGSVGDTSMEFCLDKTTGFMDYSKQSMTTSAGVSGLTGANGAKQTVTMTTTLKALDNAAINDSIFTIPENTPMNNVAAPNNGDYNSGE